MRCVSGARWRLRVPAGLFLAGLAFTGPLEAQAEGDAELLSSPRLHIGVSGAVAQPLGEFNEYVRVGGGAHAHFRVDLDGRGLVGLRLHGGVVNYGSETQRVCFSATVGCRVELDLNTSNNIFLFGVGPELGVPIGRTRLYANASLGLGYFSTDSKVSGTTDQEPFASTRNYGDGGLAWNLGTGLEVMLGRVQGQTVSLDLGLSHQENGRREYLTRGGITDLPDGSLEFDVKRSQANFLLWRIGFSIGVSPDEAGGP